MYSFQRKSDTSLFKTWGGRTVVFSSYVFVQSVSVFVRFWKKIKLSLLMKY